jgi:hypothetical protein
MWENMLFMVTSDNGGIALVLCLPACMPASLYACLTSDNGGIALVCGRAFTLGRVRWIPRVLKVSMHLIPNPLTLTLSNPNSRIPQQPVQAFIPFADNCYHTLCRNGEGDCGLPKQHGPDGNTTGGAPGYASNWPLLGRKCTVRCSIVLQGICSRGVLLSVTHLLHLNRCHACDQCHCVLYFLAFPG